MDDYLDTWLLYEFKEGIDVGGGTEEPGSADQGNPDNNGEPETAEETYASGAAVLPEGKEEDQEGKDGELEDDPGEDGGSSGFGRTPDEGEDELEAEDADKLELLTPEELYGRR